MTSKFFLAAVSASLLLGAAHSAMAAPDAPKPPKITQAVLKNLVAAQTANNKKDYPAALDAIKAAQAIPDRTPYDDFMMRFHNFLKENATYQAQGKREAWSFPPGSSWMVYTDMVPHAVLSGQYALEQTYLVSAEAMVAPEHAPVNVLQKMTGQPLV